MFKKVSLLQSEPFAQKLCTRRQLPYVVGKAVDATLQRRRTPVCVSEDTELEVQHELGDRTRVLMDSGRAHANQRSPWGYLDGFVEGEVHQLRNETLLVIIPLGTHLHEKCKVVLMVECDGKHVDQQFPLERVCAVSIVESGGGEEDILFETTRTVTNRAIVGVGITTIRRRTLQT